VVAAAFAGGASTLSILVLWNLGVPGWLPGIALAVAFGGLVTSLWSALAGGERMTAVGIVLLFGGGVGLISTYQTGLVLAAILVLGVAAESVRQSPGERVTSTPATTGPVEYAGTGLTSLVD
jgi:hypothetical protein